MTTNHTYAPPHPEHVIEQVRTLWNRRPALLAREIAEQMGSSWTRNMVLGIAHKHHFPPRKSPVVTEVQRPVVTLSGPMPEFDPAWVTEYWPEDRLRLLLELWPSNLTLTEIGRRMGCDATSVRRKAYVLWLPKRIVATEARHSGTDPERINAGADPLPAGHPIALAAIGMTYREWIGAAAR